MEHADQLEPMGNAIATAMSRQTVIVADGFALRARRLRAVRDGANGTQVMLFEQMAARLAGGFCRPVDDESLRAALRKVLPITRLGELESIKLLPGMVDAAATTLGKVWDAGIDLTSRMHEHPRLAALARLEQQVVAALPPGMRTPASLAAAATARIQHADAVLGQVRIEGLLDLTPCWRPLLLALAEKQTIHWWFGPRPVAPWVFGTMIGGLYLPPLAPEVSVVSAANAAHEAIEAMRWVRDLLASGKAQAHEIAIAAASTSEFDDHFLALCRDAELPLHFAHGVPVLSTRAGQACAALADILCNGLTQARLRRLVVLCGRESGWFAALPEGWLRVLPRERELTSNTEWERILARIAPDSWPDGVDHVSVLHSIVDLLQAGAAVAERAGEDFLSGQALSIWRKALLAGPAAALPLSLSRQKQSDGLDSCTCVAWLPAAALAATPRRFVRLLGMNANLWPRNSAEDGLLPDHVLSSNELVPLPLAQVDRRAFDAILRGTEGQLVLSRSRRDSQGRSLGGSMLLRGQPAARYLRRNDRPAQAFSETDRLQARPAEFSALAQARAAYSCWQNWRRSDITPHDGLVRGGHPVLSNVALRTHSATSLKVLLRNPLGYVWRYGLGWRARDTSAEQFTMDSRNFGNLVHKVLERAVLALEASASLASASLEEKRAAVAASVREVAHEWASQQAVPPALVWQATLEQAGDLAVAALTVADSLMVKARAYVEVPFGGSESRIEGAPIPWDHTRAIVIPGTSLRINGYIDRLDISADGKRVQVCDYKTGKTPKDPPELDGGKELQRCLYAFVVNALIGEDAEVRASLLYPHDQENLVLDQPGDVMVALAAYLRAAHDSLMAGRCLPGPDTGDKYDEFALLLPANATAVYCKDKASAVSRMLGAAATIWDTK